MNLIRFLHTEAPDSFKRIVGLTILSGVANGILLAVINAACSAADDEGQTQYMLLFLIAVLIFVIAKRTSLFRSAKLAEGLVRKLRIRIVDKIRRSDLIVLDGMTRSAIHSKATHDLGLISETSFLLINAAQGAMMMTIAMFYLAWISMIAFVITVMGIVIAGFYYYHQRLSIFEEYKVLQRKEIEFFESLNHFLDGFKEIKLSARKNDALFQTFADLADSYETCKLALARRFASHFMFHQVFLYTLITLVVFLLPRLIPSYSDILMKITVAILFIVAPLEMIGNVLPLLMRANMALVGIHDMEQAFDRHFTEPAAEPGAAAATPALFRAFSTIEASGLCFSYLDAEGKPSFSIGPLTMTLRRGETLFIVGGNGSGKSTALKLLTGLYTPSTGQIAVDHQPVVPATCAAYRELFAAIFSDFHLFDRLYGLESVSDEQVIRLIREMGIGDKTSFAGGRFTTQTLSTGQRKRLALISTLLEDRDIYVFDEWAAEQDQHFRRQFYEVILKDLKARGKTVIAVTHDDRYWHIADRVVKMEEGRVVAEDAGASPAG